MDPDGNAQILDPSEYSFSHGDFVGMGGKTDPMPLFIQSHSGPGADMLLIDFLADFPDGQLPEDLVHGQSLPYRENLNNGKALPAQREK
ncbi:MAG: hypothetical protein LBS77_02695 [Desulfovibrio sp.]|nr:hypothetical protein [Desulfovibrio sp.]